MKPKIRIKFSPCRSKAKNNYLAAIKCGTMTFREAGISKQEAVNKAWRSFAKKKLRGK